MYSKATRGCYTTDGAGREFITDQVEDAVHERLADKGITEETHTPAEYDKAFDEELSMYMEQLEDDYAEFLSDQAEAREEDDFSYYNRPGGPADYLYG